MKNLKDSKVIEHMVTAFYSCPSIDRGGTEQMSIMYGKWDKDSAGISDDVTLIKSKGPEIVWGMILRQVVVDGFSYVKDDRFA